MRVKSVSANLTFKRSLRSDEIEEYTQTLKQGKKTAGQTGNSAFIIPLTSLPVSENKDIGIGHLTSKEGIDFIDYMRTYLDFNIVKDLPSGQITRYDDFFCNYKASALALGDQNINPELLITEKYGSILTKEEFQQIVDSNIKHNKAEFINCENTMESGSTLDRTLKKAFERFKTLDENSQLKQNYRKFITENEFWLNFPREKEPDQEFFKFKQFLADAHLAEGKKLLNQRGIKLCGDCLINFSQDEVNAFPKAFKHGYNTGLPSWCILSLDYDNILDESSDAYKLLKLKVQLMAKRYDMIRFDVGWNYITPVMTPHGVNRVLDENKKELGNTLVDNIDRWVKEVKGENFDLKNLVYEVEAGPDEFAIFKPNSPELIDPLKNRVKAYSNVFMNDNWGSSDAFLRRGWSEETFSLGTGNHDHQPLRQIANGIPDRDGSIHKTDSIKPLARILNISETDLIDPITYAKSKFADMMTSFNIHYFFMDVFGRAERYNEHKNSATNFRRRVPYNYKKAYQDALNEGYGFNIMDALEKVFKSKGFDRTYPVLYSKIVKFRDILAEKEPDIPQISTPIRNETEDLIQNSKKEKSVLKSKPLWFAAGILGAAGGAFAIFKNKNKQETKPDKIYT